MVNGSLSDFFAIINISVLQGSILGPLLFLCFINDMNKSNSLNNFHFADDTTALCKGRNLSELSLYVKKEVQRLGVWLRAKKLAINASKTKVMIFHPKGKIIEDVNFVFNNNDPDDPSLIYPIERIHNFSKPHPAYKILGVFLDENLTFDYHICKLTKTISKSLYSLKCAKNLLSSNALKSLYYGLIHPHFLYCLPIFSCNSQKNLKLLALLQKRCIPIISKAKFNAHTEKLFFNFYRSQKKNEKTAFL